MSAHTATTVLSIDLDDFVTATADLHGRRPPPGHTDRLNDDTRLVLDVMDETGTRATFFVNAQYCATHGELIREIVARGHVLASHGYQHGDIRRMTLDEFRADVMRSLDMLTKFQSDIRGYRAPTFTMPFDDEHLGVLDEGRFTYASCGAAFDRTNIPRVDEPTVLANGMEYHPISIWTLLGGRLTYALGYGAVARLLPAPFYLSTLRRWLATRPYFHFYFHPYELAGLPRAHRRALYQVEPGDIRPRIAAQRCGRVDLFRAVFAQCSFRPVEATLQTT